MDAARAAWRRVIGLLDTFLMSLSTRSRLLGSRLGRTRPLSKVGMATSRATSAVSRPALAKEPIPRRRTHATCCPTTRAPLNALLTMPDCPRLSQSRGEPSRPARHSGANTSQWCVPARYPSAGRPHSSYWTAQRQSRRSSSDDWSGTPSHFASGASLQVLSVRGASAGPG